MELWARRGWSTTPTSTGSGISRRSSAGETRTPITPRLPSKCAKVRTRLTAQASPSQKQAKLWLASGDTAGLERTTLDSYRQHLDFHIIPLLGAVKLSQLTAPMVRQFEDQLRGKRSPAMVRKVLGSLSSILADAQERGLVAQNVVAWPARARRLRGKERRADKRQKGKLRVGVDIPSPDEIRAIIAALEGRWRPLLLTAIFAGLRASELRGLRWADVDLKRNVLHVRQRADCYRKMGALKSEASERTIPIAPMLANTLREWKLACPKGDLDLVFPNGIGRIESHANIINRALIPVQIAAGVTTSKRQSEVHRPARLAALLRQLVHQPPRRRRARTAAEGRAGAPRARLDPDDGRSLWASVSARG